MYNYLVEFLGTVFFIYVILATGNALMIGAALALVVMIGLYSSSIASYNPAVTTVLYAMGKINSSQFLLYVLTEVFGGLVALELFKRVKLS
jgi:glycerol uptake facilitator-like aquaporin